jgi:hypothetical protein
MTCDQTCVIRAGFIPDMIISACNAVMNDVISAGEGGSGMSVNSVCSGVVAVDARPRDIVCRIVCSPSVAELDGVSEGEGEDAPFTAVEDEFRETDTGVGGAFFRLTSERKRDQSDSN